MPNFLTHLPAHLAALERWEALVSIICSEDYIETTERRQPTHRHSLILAYQNALISVPVELQNRFWEAPPACMQLALKGIGGLVDQGELDKAQVLLQADRQIIESRNLPEVASTWNCLTGRLAIYAGDRQEAEARMAAALSLARDAGYQEGVAKALLGMAVIIRKFGDARCDAQDTIGEALAMDFSSFDLDFQARALLNLAMVHICQGQENKAEDCLRRASDLIERNDNPILYPWLHKYQGFLWLLRGDITRASEQYQQAGELFTRLGHFQEQQRCEELMLCAFSPAAYAYAYAYAQDRIEHSRHAAFDDRRILEMQQQLQNMHTIMDQGIVPGEADTISLALATQNVLHIIQELEDRFDPNPLASSLM